MSMETLDLFIRTGASKTPATECCSRKGADALKERLESYWRERGYDVTFFVHEAGFTMSMRATRFDLRSDMKNGWPTKRLLPSQGKAA